MPKSIVNYATGGAVNTLADTLRETRDSRVGAIGRKKRVLHDRSHLTLEFPQSKDRVIRTYIPFLENPQINEKGRARLNTYDLVGRAGQLFSYAGAESRRLSVTFNISLLHVLETDISEGIADKFKRQFRLFFTDREQSIRAFKLSKRIKESFRKIQGLPEDVLQSLLIAADTVAFAQSGGGKADLTLQDPQGNGRDHAAIHRAYYRQQIGEITGANADKESDGFVTDFLEWLEYDFSSSEKDINNAIDLIYCWINFIRGSVMNNSRNSTYGPPIVRLTHGPMYNNVPCLVEDYTIRILDDAGYEVQTLTPKRVQITLNMIESRTGNFGAYEPTFVETGDNITGWESIIENNDIDPYNGLIGSAGQVGGLVR